MSTCPTCNKSFEPKNGNQKYCSNTCKKQLKYNCSQCGKEVIRYKHNREQTFCSRLCGTLYSGSTLEVNCLQCNKGFTIKKSAVAMGWGKYCSQECQHKSLEKHEIRICENCGTEYEYKAGPSGSKYCSKACSNEGFRIPIDKALLEDLYIEQELTSREVGEVIGRSKKVVLDYLHYYEMEVRPDGMKNNRRIVCKDGHLVRSYYERAFDNLLYKNGIDHEYDPHLPFNKRYMADFKIQDIYVEIWGMMSWGSYREKREKKLEMYRNNNCKLLEVYPEDFKNITTKLDELKRLIS